MIVDPITEEIRTLRRSLAARHDNDLDRIYEDVRRSERFSGRQFLSLPRRLVRSPASAEPSHAPESAVGSVASGEPFLPTRKGRAKK